jgi:hypothetical protein
MATFDGTTDSSKPPWPAISTRTYRTVRDDDPDTVSILAEINLYLTATNNAYTWIKFLNTNMPPNRCTSELQELQKLMYTLISEYDLLDRTYPMNPATPITWYYVSQYPSKPTQTNRQTYLNKDRFCRKVMFINVAALVSFMELKKKRFLQALPQGIDAQYNNLYALAESAFKAWMDKARPLCGFSQSALRTRQEGGRGVGR